VGTVGRSPVRSTYTFAAAVAEREPLAAQREHVARRERVEVVLVERPDRLAVAGDHVAAERVRDRPDVGHVDDPREPAALPDERLPDRILLVVVFAVRRVVRIAPHLRVDVPLRQPLVVAGEVPHESLVLAGPELAVRVRAPENFADLPVGADLIDRHPVDVLGGHVGSSLGERHAVDEPLLGAGEHRAPRTRPARRGRARTSALDGLAGAVARPPDALEQRRDRLRRPHLHDQIEVRHVDTEFEARRRGHHVQRARLQPLLDPSTLGLAELPW